MSTATLSELSDELAGELEHAVQSLRRLPTVIEVWDETPVDVRLDSGYEVGIQAIAYAASESYRAVSGVLTELATMPTRDPAIEKWALGAWNVCASINALANAITAFGEMDDGTHIGYAAYADTLVRLWLGDLTELVKNVPNEGES